MQGLRSRRLGDRRTLPFHRSEVTPTLYPLRGRLGEYLAPSSLPTKESRASITTRFVLSPRASRLHRLRFPTLAAPADNFPRRLDLSARPYNISNDRLKCYMSKKRYLIAYYRVSTAEQGSSRLGLEAQRDAVRRYADLEGLSIYAEYEEVLSTQKERPVFEQALTMCAQLGHTLAVARLDRLSRDLHTITSLQKSGVDFVAVDMPGASKFMVQILGAVAENERDMIGERTKAALARAKANGVKLGAPDPLANVASAIYGRAKDADEFRAQCRPRIQALRQAGMTFQQIADTFNREDFPTPSGNGLWHPITVQRAMKIPTGLNLDPNYQPPAPANDEGEGVLPLFDEANRL